MVSVPIFSFRAVLRRRRRCRCSRTHHCAVVCQYFFFRSGSAGKARAWTTYAVLILWKRSSLHSSRKTAPVSTESGEWCVSSSSNTPWNEKRKERQTTHRTSPFSALKYPPLFLKQNSHPANSRLRCHKKKKKVKHLHAYTCVTRARPVLDNLRRQICQAHDGATIPPAENTRCGTLPSAPPGRSSTSL